MRVTCKHCGGAHPAFECRKKKSEHSGNGVASDQAGLETVPRNKSESGGEPRLAKTDTSVVLVSPMQSIATRKDELKAPLPGMTETKAGAAGTQALPIDNSRVRKKALAGEVPSVNEHPETEGKLVQVQQSHSVLKFDKKSWMREYMREHRKGIRRRNVK